MSDVLVLCYHGISPTWPVDTAVTPERLEEQIELLLRYGFRGATFSNAVMAPRADRTVSVTFDDAHRSVLELAEPILSKYGLPGTVFVPTGNADSGAPLNWNALDRWLGTPHEPELACLSWPELELLADGGWEIGSHTVTHPRLTQLPDRELRDELVTSREACEARLGRPCSTFAYPYSAVDTRVVRAVRDAGYTLAATVPQRFTDPLPLQWPRVGVYGRHTLTHVRLRVPLAMRRLRVSPLWSGVELVRRATRGRG